MPPAPSSVRPDPTLLAQVSELVAKLLGLVS
jgi:hypothetical protein